MNFGKYKNGIYFLGICFVVIFFRKWRFGCFFGFGGVKVGVGYDFNYKCFVSGYWYFFFFFDGGW